MKKELDAAFEELDSATAGLIDAARAEAEARRVATDARNRLNNAQKAFDGLVDMLKDTSPSECSWKRDRPPQRSIGIPVDPRSIEQVEIPRGHS